MDETSAIIADEQVLIWRHYEMQKRVLGIDLGGTSVHWRLSLWTALPIS